MKRILLVLATLALAMPLFGIGGHHAALTEEGTYYSISIAILNPDSIPATTAIQLTTQQGEEITTEIVPGSDQYGLNFEPSMYWDEASETLMVFWVRMPSMMSSEILFSSRGPAGWSEPTSIDNGIFRFRKNLRIAATHKHQAFNEEGEVITVPGLAIHAVWWDEHGGGSDTQYAILGFDQGSVTSIQRFTLTDLLDRSELQPAVLSPEFDRKFFQSPTITVHPDSDAIEVLFGDWDLNVLHKIDLIPVTANGVLTIPNGFRGTDPIVPKYEFSADATATTGSVELISGGPGSNQVAAYWKSNGSMVFSRYKNGSWSEVTKVIYNDRVSEESTARNLRRLLGRD